MAKKDDIEELEKMAKKAPKKISEEQAEKELESVELPAEIQELIESGQLPEDIIKGLQSGEVSPEDLLAYLQQLQEVPEEVQKDIEQEIKKLGFFDALQIDFQAMLFYSMNFLVEQSLQMTEESMKQDSDYQASHFTKRAEIIRHMCKEVFGFLGQKDYYLGGFKEVLKLRGEIPHEKMMEIAQFCAQNVQLDEALQANPKLLRRTFRESVNTLKGAGLPTKYRTILKEEYTKYAHEDRPDKEGVIFELYMLFKIVEEVFLSLKHGEDEEETEEESQEDLEDIAEDVEYKEDEEPEE